MVEGENSDEGFGMEEVKVNGKVFYLFIIMFVLLIFVTTVLIMVLVSQHRLRLENQVGKQCIECQKKYCDALVAREKEMRSFQHDFRKHILALEVLSREENVEGIRNYVKELHDERENQRMIKTGNAIADYFIYDLVSVLREKGNFEYFIVGKFPPTCNILDMDMSILLGNALDNAKEALLKVDGERTFEFVIRNKGKKVELEMANSCKWGDTACMTSKKNSRDHGYGLMNMQRVVRKYDGEMEYSCQKGRFVMKVRI